MIIIIFTNYIAHFLYKYRKSRLFIIFKISIRFFFKVIDCGVLPTPAKASKVLETHTRVDGMVRFKCTEKGYEISGSEIRKCLNTGSWSGTTTKCTSKLGSKKKRKNDQ